MPLSLDDVGVQRLLSDEVFQKNWLSLHVNCQAHVLWRVRWPIVGLGVRLRESKNGWTTSSTYPCYTFSTRRRGGISPYLVDPRILHV